MNKKSTTKNNQDFYILPLASIRRVFIVFGIVSFLIVLLGGVFVTVSRMRQVTLSAYQNASAQISQRVDETIKLLTSLAALPEFYEPEVPWEEKVAKLDKINEYYGYMFICYVDQDIQVYTLGEEPASLASREHMQRLYTTKTNLVTDSFVAGADGVTLNYTIAVPLMKADEMVGSLFASIYFDETVSLLKNAASVNDAQAVLIGSKGQIMSSTNGLTYGSIYTDHLREASYVEISPDSLETMLLSRETGSFKSAEGLNPKLTYYGPVENTNWDILVSVDFLGLFMSVLPILLLATVLIVFAEIMLFIFVRKHIYNQKTIVEHLVTSIQKLEKKLYHDDVPESVDFEALLNMSSKGLHDGLTGVMTRSIFLAHAEKLLGNEQKLLVLCFVDLDNLKILNDTHGHQAGDIALRQIGSILRAYETKYEGAVGRYGGDEFILILRDIEDIEELKSILAELVKKLSFNISYSNQEIKISCSIGAGIWNQRDSLETLIANADKALYEIKRHDKGTYSLFNNGEEVYEES